MYLGTGRRTFSKGPLGFVPRLTSSLREHDQVHQLLPKPLSPQPLCPLNHHKFCVNPPF